jgi:hypothetical protein
MAELDKLVIEISADDARFIQSLATIKNGLKDFGATGTASAEQVAKALKAVEKAALSTNDAAKKQELIDVYIKLNKELQRSKKEFKDLTKIINEPINPGGGAIPKLNKNLQDVDEQARRSRIAIYGLNQVVRDAPFGFIAISNNIPVLFDQLGQLRAETGSNTNAFKAFGKGLIGPGGIAIGLSAVVSLITTAVQKYGSLGAAFDALIGKSGALSEEQKKFAEGLASEVAEISVLVGAYPELSSSRADQEGILKKLNNLQPEYFKSLNTEKTTIDDLRKSYDEYLKSLLARIFIEQQTKQIEEIAKSYALQLTKLLEKEKQVRAESDKKRKTTQNLVKTQQQLVDINNNLRKGGDISIGVELLVKPLPKTFDQLIKEVSGSFKDEVKSLQDVQKDFFKAIDFTGVFSDTKKESKGVTDQEKKKKQEVDDSIAAYKLQLETLKETLSTTSKITQEYANIKSEIIRIQAEIDKLQEPQLAPKIELNATEALNKVQQELTKRQFDAGEVKFTPVFDFNDKVLKELEKTIDGKIKIKGSDLPLNIPPELLERMKQYNLELSLMKLRNEELKPIIDAISNTLQNSFGNFIDSFIDGFAKGQTSIESFQESLKELGRTILKEVAKLALLTAIRAISDSIAPGSGAATAGLTNRLLGAAAPRIGGGMGMGLPVGPGGIAIQGNVTFVQRGQDLVGVLARSNARINRVG